MNLLISSVVLGLAGIDILGIPIVLAAISAKSGKRLVIIFANTVFFATIIGGVAISFFLGKSVLLIANFFKQLPNSFWIGLDILLITILAYWLYGRLRRKKTQEKTNVLSSWVKQSMFVVGLLFAATAIPDPSFIALTAMAAHNGNVVNMLLAFTVWILLSQFPVFLLSISVATNQHEHVIKKLDTLKAKYATFFRYGVNITLGISILFLLFDLGYFWTTNTWFFD